MNIKSIALFAGLAFLGALSEASAATVVLDYSGNFGYGTDTGTITLDVTGSSITGGTATATGANITGTVDFTLVTSLNYPGPSTGWRAGDGTDWYGGDLSFPIDVNGPVFNSAPWGQGYVFGIYSDGSTGYQGALFGPGGPNNFYAYNVPLSVTVSTVPEPSTWAMLLLGFAGIGAMMCRRRQGAILAA
jgi:hypothetical protein